MIPSFIKVPNTPIKLAKRMGLGGLRRHKKDGRVAGIAGMIAHLVYSSKPSSYQITKIRFLTFAVISLAPDGSGLFMYLFLWLIIPPDTKEEESEKFGLEHKKELLDGPGYKFR
jgi:phage shock protein PspC (stress-responsive transcriptional regulator)